VCLVVADLVLRGERFVVRWLVVESDLSPLCSMGEDVCYVLSILLMLPATSM